MHQRKMMVIFFLFGFVFGANSCSDHEFQCGSGKCIDVTKYCDGYPDCLDESDEVIGCEAECVLNDLKKFLYKDEPVKAVYRSGDTISISCPMDYDYGIAYGHDYNLEETSTELTCNDGRWVGYIPKCIGNEDSNIKSTPTADLDAVTNSIDVNATHVLAGSTSNARSEFGNSRGDDIKPQTDIGFITTTEKSYADKAACQLNGLSQYLMKNQPAKELYRYGQKIIIACPRDDSDDHEYDYNQLSDDSHSELTCHDGQWIGSYPECFKSCIPDVLKDFLMEDHDATAEYRSGEIISVSCPRNSSESQGAKKIWDYEFDDQARANWTKYLTCLNGRWVGEYPECFERCRRSRIQGTLVVKTESEYFLPGDVVQIQICWGNFPVEGDGQLTCMANGVWYGNATCPPLSDSDCLTPPDVQYAYISGNQWDRYPEGSVITYKCRQAYWLRGNNKLTCINGKWTEEQFYCEIRTCLYPGEIENGQILNMTVEVGQYNHFRCNEGYTLKGPHTMLCYADGTFHSDMMMPTCEAVECQPLKPPEHGWIDQNKDYNNKVRNNFGSYLWVRCMEGYQLIGPVRRHCQANGTWSGEDAICQKRGANCYRIPEVPGAKIYGERRQMYADGSNISYICVEDYILSGNNQFLCVDGQWMGGDFNCTSPVCKLSPLDLRYGRFHGVDRMTIVHGESVSIRKTVNCDEGFTVPPNISYISCYNGTLDPPKFDCVKYDDSISSCHLSKNEGKLIRYRDKCYLATKYTFRFGNPNAKTFCQTLGFKAYLAIIPDKETNEAIRYLMNMVPRKNKYWFGAMWNNDNSRWEWPNGKPLNYTNWKSGEGGKTAYVVKFEHCAILTSDGLWEDKNCRPFVFTGDTYMAICEIPANW
ncbi:hypothetical protein CHS0354_016867 [Potamilus streckersoni]|uniref:Uncharacterized protein n=1 Tax=Potamilus streckersoni TaxID=2493646 RepID=A0AAE0S8B7_9BIVA|nr:hypothetical protein CHS0354_016867 [Potamilus streckersoni]